MFIYCANVVAIVILSSLLLIYLLKRNNMLNTRIVMAVAVSSIIISVLFPFVFSSFYNLDGFATANSKIALALLATLLVHITLILLFTILASFIINDDFDKKMEKFFGKGLTFNAKHKGIDVERLVQRGERAAATEPGGIPGSCTEPVVIAEQVNNPVNSGAVKAIELTVTGESAENPTFVEPAEPEVEAESTQTAAITAEGLLGENISEKPVDSEQNIDKMGLDIVAYIEHNEVQSVDTPENGGEIVNTSLEACIDEAFRLKEAGDFEGSILYYMYALDRDPDNNLVFLIILDICTLYKTLGQYELAREILESYASGFGAVMDDVVRLEIERNLQYI